MYVYAHTHSILMLNSPAYAGCLVKNEISGPILE